VIVTPFGEFKLDDRVAESMWLEAHGRRHMAETVAAQINGGIQLLDGEIDGDWFHRHWTHTVAIATVTSIDLSGYTQLSVPRKWRTLQEMLDWHELHNRLHLKQDRQLGLI
jgi:hypothetical protein